MNTRREQVKELMEGMRAFGRSAAFRPKMKLRTPRITPSQWGVLMLIHSQNESTVKDIASALGITSSAATQLIDGLVTSGYVVREMHAEDRRKVTLTLSGKTKKQVEKIKAQNIERFLKFFEVFTDKEFAQFIALNNKLFSQYPTNKKTL